MSGDTLPFPGGEFPRPFGVPQVPGPEWRFGLESDLIPGHDPVGGVLLHHGRPVAVVIEVNGAEAQFQTALHFLQNATAAQVQATALQVAGPESAAEHLRNALQLFDVAIEADDDPVNGPWNAWLLDLVAVRRRVAAALAQLEEGR